MTFVSPTTWEGNASTVWHEQFVAGLEARLKLFDQACQQAQVATTEYAQIIDHPSDFETLYSLNVGTLMGFDLIWQWMQKIVNLMKGSRTRSMCHSSGFSREETSNLREDQRRPATEFFVTLTPMW